MTETRPERPGMITATEARALLGISRSTLARMLADGRLPNWPDPLDKRKRLVRRDDMDAMRRGDGIGQADDRPAPTPPAQPKPGRAARAATGADAGALFAALGRGDPTNRSSSS